MVALWVIAITLLLGCLAISSVPQTLWKFYQKCKALRKIPGWPTHWFWGNLHQFLSYDEKTVMDWLGFIRDNQLRVTKLWLGPFYPLVVLTHCDTIQNAIKLPKDPMSYDLFKPWLGGGLLLSEDKKWFRNRRLLTPAFHFKILKGYTPVVNSCLQVFMKKWVAAAREGTSVSAFKDISKLSLDIVMRCAFSTESNCQLSGDHPYITAVCDINTLITARFLSVFHMIDLIYSLSANGKKFKKACQILHEYTESVIRERKQVLGNTTTLKPSEVHVRNRRKYLDFVDILLMARDESGQGLTDLEIRDEADTFMFAGHDTTTSSMSWTLYCLAKHPEHQDKVREEVSNVLMGREWLEYEDLKELSYTTWCIKEAMRLYPPAHQFMRISTEDIEIENYEIPKGTTVMVQTIPIHRHPDTWENPDEYNPLHFHPSNAEGRHPYAYIPFSAGYRNCIGQNFALNEAKMVIASIVNRFQVSLDPRHKVELMLQLVTHTKNDIKLILAPIE